MEIKGVVHCFFEQSGTFKNEFKKLGYEAYDYDIHNNFGETDYDDDLFKAIEDAYDGKPSLFDRITPDDLIMAFFPCIYFCGSNNPPLFNGSAYHLPILQTINHIIKRNRDRAYFYELLMKLCYVVYERNLRMIFENPYDDSPDYARNFICDFILGKKQDFGQMELF